MSTKNSQFSPFFGFQEFEKNMSTPKLINFPHFLDSRSLRKNMSTPKLLNFPHFLASRSLRKNMSTPKLGNFPHFLDSRSWEKRIYIYNINMYIRYIYIHMYITWFCYIWRVVVLSFIPSTPKLVNFVNFLESRSWEKNMSTPKLVNFQHFWIPGVEKNMYVYIYIYIIFKCVHMYITWFCYIWRVVVLSFIPSTPKLVNFANFLESRSWGKNMSTPKLVNFPHFLDSKSWQKNMSTPKLVNFPHFWIPGVKKKHVCIYI